ncbi:MAG: DNA mismatch repair endonuclease MutL [Bacteroidota bacterium]|nr:DNA mismatch repair endonuclease MutL [Bacteroidota bacterium]
MLDIIQLLPDSLANQIAAGEVVQRPASVVKELLENAIDAKSTKIQVIIKEAGKTLIQIIDNGIGMSETDARMSFERHATSKIKKSEDLFSIRTLGFRGEALASIAAVAQVELKSKRDADELGTCIAIEGSHIKKQGPAALQKGTTFSVKNLFFNVPARRNFLKSNPVEMRHIIDEFQRIALSNPSIECSLFHNDLEIYHLTAGKLSHRIVALFGKNYQEQLVYCKEEVQHVAIEGYIGKPEFSKKTRGEQFFFVNNRYIKNHYLHHAVLNAYEGLLPDDSHPFYVLFIIIDPKHIDINVHPTKTEIKFDDERTIYAIIRAAVKQALGTHNITPSINFDHDVNFQAISFARKDPNNYSGNKNYEQYRNTPRENNNQNLWEKIFEKEHPGNSFDFNQTTGNEQPPNSITFGSASNNPSYQDSLKKDFVYHEEGRNNYQVHNQYILNQVKSGLMIIDQQAAHERVLYEKYLGALDKKSGASQQFLFPQALELSPSDFSLVMELENEIKSLGFIFSIFGKNSIVINGGPADFQGGNEKELFEGLIEQFKQNRQELSLDKKDNLARSIARRSSIKAGQKLSNKEMGSLIDQLFGCSNPNYAPNGQLTYYILDLNRISNFFNK